MNIKNNYIVGYFDDDNDFRSFNNNSYYPFMSFDEANEVLRKTVQNGILKCKIYKIDIMEEVEADTNIKVYSEITEKLKNYYSYEFGTKHFYKGADGFKFDVYAWNEINYSETRQVMTIKFRVENCNQSYMDLAEEELKKYIKYVLVDIVKAQVELYKPNFKIEFKIGDHKGYKGFIQTNKTTNK